MKKEQSFISACVADGVMEIIGRGQDPVGGVEAETRIKLRKMRFSCGLFYNAVNVKEDEMIGAV
jgi:hypothetical protein